GNLLGTKLAHQPGQTEECAPLRHRHTQGRMIKKIYVQIAPMQCILGHMGRELQTVQVRKAALPARKRGRPISPVRNSNFRHHVPCLTFEVPKYVAATCGSCASSRAGPCMAKRPPSIT